MESPRTNMLELPPPEVLESLPEKQREMIVEAAVFSGQPPPSICRAYEAILLGSAERLLKWAERQLGLETVAIKRASWRQRLAVWIGVAAVLAFLASAMFLAVTGHAGSADVIATASCLAATATVLIEGFMRERRSRGPRQSEPPVS